MRARVCVPVNAQCLGAGTADSPQGADEAIDGAFGVQGHDIPDMQEAGGRVRHPAAAPALTAAGGAGGAGENFLPVLTVKLSDVQPSASACLNRPKEPPGAGATLFLAAATQGLQRRGRAPLLLRAARQGVCVYAHAHDDRLPRFKKKKKPGSQ